MKTAVVLNGPNLNLLGVREPHLYGSTSLAEVEALCRRVCAELGLGCDFRQTNHEGVLVDWLQEAGRAQAAGEVAGVILNAGAYTHTSVALHDAIKGAGDGRDVAVVAGFGVQGYPLAIAALAGI